MFPILYFHCVHYLIVYGPEKCGKADFHLSFHVHMQSWEWTCGKIITELLEMLERTKLDSFAVAVVTLLGQLGRYV